jgi:hypothetical protein
MQQDSSVMDKPLEPFSFDVDDPAAVLAVHGIGIVTLKPAGGAFVVDLGWPEERLRQADEQP